MQIKINRTIILPVLYGCEDWSLTLREERRLRMFEGRVLRRIFGPKRKSCQRSREKYITRKFMTSTPHQILLG